MRWMVAVAVGCTSREPSRPPRDPVSPPRPEVVAATVADGRLPTDRELRVELSRPASLAALCTDDQDPAEQHLVESTDAATSHVLRLQGLLPDRAYTCVVSGGTRVPVGTGPGPGLPALSVEVDPELGMTGSWTLLSFVDGGGCDPAADPHLVLYDADGVARWWYALPADVSFHVEALYHPSDGAIVWGGGSSADGGPHVVDPWTGEAWVLPSADRAKYHHDGKRLPDGTFLTLSETRSSDGVSAWKGFGVRVSDPSGAALVELASDRYTLDGTLPPGTHDDDPYHANWVEHAADPVGGDQILVSLCRDASVLSIDAGTGEVRWKLGEGLGWTVEDDRGPLDPADALPQCAHGLEVVGEDTLLVYDNGRERLASQVTELRIDAAAARVEVLWQWSEPDWYENSLGDVDDLGGGRVLVTQGHAECWSAAAGDTSAVVEVDRATGRVASRLGFPDPRHLVYRAERYDGCALFSSLRACPALRDRALALADELGVTP